MRLFERAAEALSRAPGVTLKGQIIAEAKRRGEGWESAADDLAALAVEITGDNRPAYGKDFSHICREVFRTE